MRENLITNSWGSESILNWQEIWPKFAWLYYVLQLKIPRNFWLAMHRWSRFPAWAHAHSIQAFQCFVNSSTYNVPITQPEIRASQWLNDKWVLSLNMEILSINRWWRSLGEELSMSLWGTLKIYLIQENARVWPEWNSSFFYWDFSCGEFVFDSEWFRDNFISWISQRRSVEPCLKSRRFCPIDIWFGWE